MLVLLSQLASFVTMATFPEILDELQECYPPVSQMLVRQLELELEATLPQDYKQFLLRYNGGEFMQAVDCPLKEHANMSPALDLRGFTTLMTQRAIRMVQPIGTGATSGTC